MNDLATLPSPVEASDEELFRFTSGPRNASCILVGEAWGYEESLTRKPFVGSSGKELTRMLADAGLSREQLLLTNVVHLRPAGNDFTELLAAKGEKVNAFQGLKAKPDLRRGVEDLFRLIDRVRPRLIIASGNIPLWALSNHAGLNSAGSKPPTGITTWRGSQTHSRSIGGRTYPLLPIIHPAAILREWGFRAITVHDLRRATRFLSGGQPWRGEAGKTFRFIKPTWAEVENRLFQMRRRLDLEPFELAVDLETYKRRWVSTIGLADDKTEICIPLIKPTGGGAVDSYFTLGQEQVLWQELKYILEHPNVRIIGQNFIYDTEWFYRYYNIQALVHFDTMVAHHLLFPGTPKRLDYLASLYCDHYCYWKDESGDWNQLPDDPIQYWTYNTKDTRSTYECAQVLKKAIQDSKLEELFSRRMRAWITSRNLSLRGISFDTRTQTSMRLSSLTEANQLSTWLLMAVPESLQFTSTGKPWFQSPKATAFLLYSVLGFSPILHKKTKKPTANDEALAELSERAEAAWLRPLFDRLRHLRSLSVFVSHFLEARVGSDGRMRCSFNIAHPETHRWSSNANGFGEGTNLQNIPSGDQESEAEKPTSSIEFEEEEEID